MVAGWSKNTQAELRTLLRSHGQPTDGSKAALVQRLTAFLSDYAHEATGDDGGPGAGEVAAKPGESNADGGAELELARCEAAAVAAQAGAEGTHRAVLADCDGRVTRCPV